MLKLCFAIIGMAFVRTITCVVPFLTIDETFSGFLLIYILLYVRLCDAKTSDMSIVERKT